MVYGYGFSGVRVARGAWMLPVTIDDTWADQLIAACRRSLTTTGHAPRPRPLALSCAYLAVTLTLTLMVIMGLVYPT